MKILHIIPAYLPAYRYGGPVECVHSWNVGLVRAGHEVTVFTTDINGEDRLNIKTNTPVIMDGVQVFYFPGSFPRSWFYSGDLRRALAERMGEFDIVHITSVFLSASTLGAYYAKKFKKPYIISPHGSLMREPLLMSGFKKHIYISLLERKNLADAAAIHFTVPVEEEEYKNAGFPLKSAMIVPNSVPRITVSQNFDRNSFRKEWHIPIGDKLVLFLGRISPIKGLDALIPAFAAVLKKMPDAMLAIVGGDDRGYRSEIEKLIEKYGVSKRVVFTGMITGEKKESAYESADVFVVPSVSENFGMSAVEAMRAGVPTIMTDGVGISKLISDARAAIVVPKRDADIAQAMIGLLESEDRRRELGKRGREFVEREFSEASVAKRFESAYRRIIEGTKRAL